MFIKIKIKTMQEPATEAHFSSDLNPLLRLCSVSETWVAAYVLWVLRGGFLITIYALVNWKLDFLKRKGNYASELAFLCMCLCVCVWACAAVSFNLNGEKRLCYYVRYSGWLICQGTVILFDRQEFAVMHWLDNPEDCAVLAASCAVCVWIES